MLHQRMSNQASLLSCMQPAAPPHACSCSAHAAVVYVVFVVVLHHMRCTKAGLTHMRQRTPGAEGSGLQIMQKQAAAYRQQLQLVAGGAG